MLTCNICEESGTVCKCATCINCGNKVQTGDFLRMKKGTVCNKCLYENSEEVKGTVVSKLVSWLDVLASWNLEQEKFPHIHNILKDINPPHDVALVREYFNTVMAKRAAEYCKTTPQSLSQDLEDRMTGLVADLRSEGY